MKSVWRNIPILCISVLILTHCGGGGGSGSSQQLPPAPTTRLVVTEYNSIAVASAIKVNFLDTAAPNNVLLTRSSELPGDTCSVNHALQFCSIAFCPS